MPTLKDLVCHVQWADTGSAFPEYGTIYGDGVVETYLAIPSHPQAFTIRLTSRKFIYEGLSMVVFIDGNYQCNRNRVNLQPTKKDEPDNRTKIDFLVRQKEKPLGEGAYMGREWRFDDCNLVSQLPAGVDEGHFDELGTIEVLVLRCKSNQRDESQNSTTSSAEHSGIMDDDEEGREEVQAEDSGSQSNIGNPTTQPEPAQPEAQDAFGGLFGLFDGPADCWPSSAANPGDAPSDGYSRWHWQAPGGHPPPYGPQERPHHSSDYRPAPEPYAEQRRTRYDYHDSPPLSAYARPPNPPPPGRPERHVHFDYGDRRDAQPFSYHTRYDHQPHHEWDRDDQHVYTQSGPSFHRPEYHRHRNIHPDYSGAPEGRHYMYDADRKVYSHYPDSNQIYGSSQPRTPPASHSTQHSYYHPPSHGVNHDPPRAHGHPTFAASQANLPNSAPSVTPLPPLPPKIPIQPTSLPPIQPRPVHYPIPVWMPPPTMPVPPFPAAIPIYPPPNNVPIFQTQRIDTSNVPTNQNASTSAAGAVPNQSNGGNPQQNWGDDANNGANNNPSTAQSNSTQNPPEDTNNSNNDGGWANEGANGSGSNNNSQSPNNYGNNYNDTSNYNNSPNGNNFNQGFEENNMNNGTGQGWNNDDGNAGGPNWQDEQDQNYGGYQQANNGDSWENENRNSGAGGNGPASNGSNNQNSGPTPNNEPVPSGNVSNSRSLYGPHGAYYTSKACAQNAAPAEAEEEPRYDVPQAIAQSKGITKQVQPGQGYLYNKRRCTPHYVDDLDEPYARFVFKYRTKEQLKDEIGVEITAEPSPNEDVNALENLDKAELIQMVLRAKGALGGTIPSPPPKVTPPLVKSFEQVPVDAPDVGFLRYTLPHMRNVSNATGLGIRLSNASVNQSNAGNANASNSNNDWNTGSNNDRQNGGNQQNTNWKSGGAQNWQENNNQQGNNGGNNQTWENGGNNNNNNNNNNNSGSNSNRGWDNAAASNKNGWDGQQEKPPSVASQRSRNFGAQAASRRSSAISPKDQSSAQTQTRGQVRGQGSATGRPGEMLDRILNNPEEAARMGMAGPPPPLPPAPIAFTGSGTVGGGQTNIEMGISGSGGAGPRPPTPTGPPPPCSPLSDQGQGGFTQPGWEENPAQPAGGW